MLRAIGIAVLTAATAMPALAQQRESASPDMRKEAEAVAMKWEDAINRGDTSAAAQVFAQDAVLLTPGGVQATAAQRAHDLETLHKRGLHITMKIDHAQPMFGGQGLTATGPYTATFASGQGPSQAMGNWVEVLEKESGAWKIRVAAFTRTPPPAGGQATTGTSTQPSTGGTSR